jgi:RND family efflux transporter MFP subunit
VFAQWVSLDFRNQHLYIFDSHAIINLHIKGMSHKKTETADLSALRIDRELAEDNGSSSNSSRKVYIFLAAAILVSFAAYFWLTPGDTNQIVQTWTVAKVYPNQADAILTASGYIVAQRQAAIASKGTGRLEFLAVEEGDAVKAGAIIAQLEHADVDAALAQANANVAVAAATLEQTKANLQEAVLNFKRQENLLKKNLISGSEYDIAEARFRSAEATVAASDAQVDLAKAALVSAEVDVENTNIRAPFDGTVLTKNADIGEMVAPFAASSNSRGAVVTIADMSSLEVEADVSESNIQRVRAGQPCEIILDAFPTERYQGYVHKIVPTADRAKATVLTKIRFRERDEKVLPEMSAKVNFLSGATMESDATNEPFTGVPKAAVVSREGRDVVFLVRSVSVTEVPISVGRQIGGQVEVLDGVSEGDQVVLNPSADLKSGAKVRIE